MALTDRLNALPEPIEHRAKELHNLGVPITEAVGRATRELSSREDDWDIETIADAFGVSVETLRSYMSKAGTRMENAEALFIAESAGPNTILASSTDLRGDTIYITASLDPHLVADDYESARTGDHGVRVFVVQKGGPSGEPDGSINIRSERYSSLDALADDKYREGVNGSDYASRWYSLLVEAGVEEETLKKPGEMLPDSHPDSAGHFQHQMRSLEPPESRRPPNPHER